MMLLDAVERFRDLPIQDIEKLVDRDWKHMSDSQKCEQGRPKDTYEQLRAESMQVEEELSRLTKK